MNIQLNLQLDTLLKKEIKRLLLPDTFLETIYQWLIPIADSINHYKLNKNKPVIISFNGAQGSGKSTLTHFIALILTHHFKQYSINISFDDFYLSKKKRLQLALKIHPLLKTRGVPGTHDLPLAISTLKHLSQCSRLNPCFIPQFNKATDDQSPKEKWIKIEEPVQIILFEGWCNHAPIQNSDELKIPINKLEQEEDPDGIWRHYVNEQLKIYHHQLFSLCDLLYFIKIPDFKKVPEWRGLQEYKLRTLSKNRATMDHNELLRFIQHFERITKQCLKTLNKVANTTIKLNGNHKIQEVVTYLNR